MFLQALPVFPATFFDTFPFKVGSIEPTFNLPPSDILFFASYRLSRFQEVGQFCLLKLV